MKLLFCELDALLARDSASALASLLPDSETLLARLRQIAPLRAAAPNEAGEALHHLLLPFLALHQVGVAGLSSAGRLVLLAEGATDLVRTLAGRGWAVRLCSNTYEPYPSTVAARFGLDEEHVITTPFPEEALTGDLGAYALASISELGEDLRDLPIEDIAALTARVERFYTDDISYSGFADALKGAAPLRGQDWVALAEQAIAGLGLSWSHTAAIGWSDTAGPLLGAVRAGGGLAVAVKSDHALGVAALLPLIEDWERRG